MLTITPKCSRLGRGQSAGELEQEANSKEMTAEQSAMQKVWQTMLDYVKQALHKLGIGQQSGTFHSEQEFDDYVRSLIVDSYTNLRNNAQHPNEQTPERAVADTPIHSLSFDEQVQSLKELILFKSQEEEQDFDVIVEDFKADKDSVNDVPIEILLRYEQYIVDKLWERVTDYIAEHYPTQGSISALNDTPQGKQEREAMRKDPALAQLREEVKAQDKAAQRQFDTKYAEVKAVAENPSITIGEVAQLYSDVMAFCRNIATEQNVKFSVARSKGLRKSAKSTTFAAKNRVPKSELAVAYHDMFRRQANGQFPDGNGYAYSASYFHIFDNGYITQSVFIDGNESLIDKLIQKYGTDTNTGTLNQGTKTLWGSQRPSRSNDGLSQRQRGGDERTVGLHGAEQPVSARDNQEVGRDSQEFPAQRAAGEQLTDPRFSAADGTQFILDPDYGIRFSIRTEPAPKKTGIGYKVFFRGKDGKLYPPMVANPNGADTPVGVWLNADAAPITGESKTGRPQVKAGGKGTQGGSGQLAYRPGWHLGEIPYALQFNRKDADGNRTLFPKDFVWAEVEYAADNDYQQEAEREGYTDNGKYRHSYAGLKHLPTDGFYRYRTNPNPETDPWIITGAMKVNRVLSDEEVDELVRRAGREPQRREATQTSENDIRFSASAQSIAQINDQFNKELARYAKGEMKKNERLHLGLPNGVMRIFLPNLPIVMRQHILTKGSVSKHNVAIEALADMPLHISQPIFVFERSNDTLGILTEMKDRDNKNVCVAIELQKTIQDGGDILEINDITSVHGREFKNIVEPIANNETLKWVDKEKGLAYLSSASQQVLQEIDKQILETAAKIVQNFENPKLPSENDAEYLAAVERGDMQKAAEMVQEAARAAGYTGNTDYQGVGAWGAPTAEVDNEDFANLDASKRH